MPSKVRQTAFRLDEQLLARLDRTTLVVALLEDGLGRPGHVRSGPDVTAFAYPMRRDGSVGRWRYDAIAL